MIAVFIPALSFIGHELTGFEQAVDSVLCSSNKSLAEGPVRSAETLPDLSKMQHMQRVTKICLSVGARTSPSWRVNVVAVAPSRRCLTRIAAREIRSLAGKRCFSLSRGTFRDGRYRCLNRPVRQGSRAGSKRYLRVVSEIPPRGSRDLGPRTLEAGGRSSGSQEESTVGRTTVR